MKNRIIYAIMLMIAIPIFSKGQSANTYYYHFDGKIFLNVVSDEYAVFLDKKVMQKKQT